MGSGFHDLSLRMESTETNTLYTRSFILLCLSHGFFAGSFNMMIPELPNYLSNMGGADYKGWIIALFTVTAGISRPFSGKLTDSIGRIPVMYIGVIACVICSVSYPLLVFVQGFLFLRFLHGFSTGFKPTGTAAYVADIVPENRRGEAMGTLGICMSVGASSAPPLGSWLASIWGIDAMFYASAVFAGFSMVILMNLPETLPKIQPFHPRLLKVTKDDIFDPLALPAAITIFFCYFSYGTILTIVPDLSDHVGVANRGIFFSIFTFASISTRLFAGKLSDQWGRVPVLKVSAIIIAVAMFSFAFTTNPSMLYLSSALFGLGNGLFSPAITAWAIDLGAPGFKGRALSTMYIGMEISIGGGAALAGSYFADDFSQLPFIFEMAGFASLLGLTYLFLRRKPK